MAKQQKTKRSISDYIQFHPRQEEAVQYIGKGWRIFYGGARGGGKSYLALAIAVIMARRFPKMQVVCIRKTYNELEEVFINKLQTYFPDKIFGYQYRDKSKTATFKNKSRILFRSCETMKDAQKVMGAEYQFMILDEAPNFDSDIIDSLIGSLRNAHVTGFEATLLMTGNPGGISDHWFKTRFVEPDYAHWTEGELELKDKYVFIPAKVQDNPSLEGTNYLRSLKAIRDPNKRRAWMDGDWSAFEGQFFSMWNPEKHIVDGFDIPESWRKAAGFDLGYTEKHPSVGLWGAQDPESGNVYIYREYTSASNPETNIRDIKAIVPQRELDVPILGDPSMFDDSTKKRPQDLSTGMMFLTEKLPLLPANNARVNGWRVLKQWLSWDEDHPPKLYVFKECQHLIQTIPLLTFVSGNRTGVTAEDLETRGPDDAADALRYLMVSAFEFPSDSYKEPEDYKSVLADKLGRDPMEQQAEPSQREDDDYYDDHIPATYGALFPEHYQRDRDDYNLDRLSVRDLRSYY